MENYVIVKDENGMDIKIEVILSFTVEEFNKQYISYVINDDGMSDGVAVFISEIDPVSKRIISIPNEQKEVVLMAYEEAKKALIEE